MSQSKKILVCHSCSFYPTKAQSHEIHVDSESIIWKCKVCNNTNTYIKKWPVCLPSTNHIVTPVSNLLHKQQNNTTENYYMLIKPGPRDELIDLDLFRSKILSECLGQKYKKVLRLKTLMQQSRLWSLLRRRQTALMKFIKEQKIRERYFSSIDYFMCLLEKYLTYIKNERHKKNKSLSLVKISICVEQEGKNFVFSFDNLQIEQNKKQFQNFILVYLLVNIKEVPKQIVHHYKPILTKYQKQLNLEQDIQQLLILDSQNKIVELIKQPQKQEIKKFNLSQTFTRSQKFDYSPFAQNTFAEYLNDLYQQKESYREFIEVFFRQRRKSTIYKLSLQNNLKEFKKMLLGRSIIKKQDQSFLKDNILKIVQQRTQKTRLQLVKLVGYFQEAGCYLIVLFTFNWSKIQSEQLVQSLQQPQNYHHILKEDVIPVEYPLSTRKATNPFGKKSFYEQICNKEDEQSDNDEFISL